MSATLVSPPPHEQQNTRPAGPIASSPRLHSDGVFLTGAGRRSLLPPLIRSGSPPARSSSPRHHASANQSQPTAGQRQTSTANHHNNNNNNNNNNSHIELAAIWGDDTVNGNHLDPLPNPYDQYLTPLDESDLNPANFPLSPPGRTSTRTATNDLRAAASRPSQTHNLPHPGPSRTETQLTGTSWADSLNTHYTDDLFGDDGLLPSSQSSVSDTMPATRKRNAAVRESSPVSKRPRTLRPGVQEPTFAQPYVPATNFDDDDLFGESPREPNAEDEQSAEELPTIDLTEANEVPQSLKKPEVDKRIKISAFQCVICMDDVTTLTVTHCGHLYCAQCLHSSLHVEATKGKCPMCRSKIDMKPRGTYTSKTKGYWPLELKLMTTTRKGKRKANPIT